MNKQRKMGRRSEEGIALLIAIFVLLLISVVAIALLVSSGTETALGANYRSSSTVYYAALAGLEEARGRLLPKNPTYFNNIDPSFIPAILPIGQTRYVINRLPGENIVPWDSSNTYYDKEYQSEFNQAASSASWQSVSSVWDNNVQGFPGPMYKWVRITAATEQSLYLDVNSDGVYDHSTPIYYNPSQVDSHGNPSPGLIVTPSPPPTAVQVLQITALAYLPNGSQKLLQYVVAPVSQSVGFPAALTFDGPNAGSSGAFPLTVPYSAAWLVDGTDQYFYSSSSGCPSGHNPSPAPVRAIGYSNSGGTDTSLTNIMTAIQQGHPPPNNNWNYGDFTGLGSALPNVYYVGGSPPSGPPTLASNLQTLPQINALVSGIARQADLTLVGPVTQSDSTNLMPAGMSPTNPITVVVNGDFTENGWSGAGYGILLVTGTFTYDANSSWNGIILVVGKGVFLSTTGYANNTAQINGAVFIATTLDANGNPPANGLLGSPTFDFQGYGNLGIYYSSCWVQYVQTAGKYQVLSFHEIPQS